MIERHRAFAIRVWATVPMAIGVALFCDSVVGFVFLKWTLATITVVNFVVNGSGCLLYASEADRDRAALDSHKRAVELEAVRLIARESSR